MIPFLSKFVTLKGGGEGPKPLRTFPSLCPWPIVFVFLRTFLLYISISLWTGYISDLQNTYQSSQLPVTDDETILHKFCVKLETVLRHEQKGNIQR